jgi:hypothetical protein
MGMKLTPERAKVIHAELERMGEEGIHAERAWDLALELSHGVQERDAAARALNDVIGKILNNVDHP